MDELTLIRSFRAERTEDDPRARAAAWRQLEARFDAAPETPSAPPSALRRRGLLALAGAAAAAAAALGVLVLGSGPTAQPAAAEILHKTAAVATSPDAPASSTLPGPGQFYFSKFKRLELVSWNPRAFSEPQPSQPLQMSGGVLRRPGTFAALMPTTQEWWTAADGAGRVREVAGSPHFLTDKERARWEATGSRLPAPFDPEYQRLHALAFKGAIELRRGVLDTEHPRLARFGFPDTSSLPTDPRALRLAVESNRISVRGFNLMYPSAKRLDAEQTIAELFNILSEGNPKTPQLRAAIFNALAEVPGIEVDTAATDFLGRHGYAVRSIEPQTGGGIEFIFDPRTSQLLAQRSFLGDRGQGPYLKGLPAGTTIRETAYLESGLVDSTHETAAAARAGDSGPLAAPGPAYHR